MKCSEVIEVLGRLAPESCACDWDNPGLLAGRSDKEVKKIYIALDATDQVVEAAIKGGADMLLTHHPLIFKAIKKVNDQNFITRRLVKLIQADISYYAMHTNFDAAPGCMADLAAERLSLKDTEPLECMGDMEINGNPVAYGIGKTGKRAGKLTVKALAEKVKQAFDLPFVLVYGEELMDMEIEKAVSYTHLDVYKRQITSNKIIIFLLINIILLFVGTFMDPTPDVYKRQLLYLPVRRSQ